MYVIVDFICMCFLEMQEAEARITKWKNFAHSGTGTHDSWIVKQLLLPLGYKTWYTFDKLKRRPGFPCVIYIYIIPHGRLFCLVFNIVVI